MDRLPLVPVLAVAVLIAACAGSDGSRAGRPPEIEDVFPHEGDQIISQGEVGADVPQGWELTLTIDSTIVPRNQLEAVEQLGIFKFLPRPGKVIERLPRGDHRARVDITSLVDGRRVHYEWPFRVSA